MIIIMMFYMLISNIIMMLSMLISKKMKLNFEKMSPFECGFNTMNFKRLPFSMRFFLITIIFLIFDIEIALLLPMIIVMKNSNFTIWMITIIIFMIILMIGLIYEWKKNALNWI